MKLKFLYAAVALFSAAVLFSLSGYGKSLSLPELPHRPDDGMGDVRKASFLGRDKKWDEGKAFIKKLRQLPQKGRSVEQRQSVDMAEYGLLSQDFEANRDRCIEVLKAAYDASPSSFWGWAAYYYLKKHGRNVPCPKRDPLRGLGEYGDGVVNLKVEYLDESERGGDSKNNAFVKRMEESSSEILSHKLSEEDLAPGTDLRKKLLRLRLIDVCGAENLESLLATPKGKSLFASFWSNDAMMEDFLLSGPVFDAPFAIEVLLTLLNNDLDGWHKTKLGRHVTVAIAINAKREEDKKKNLELIVRHWAAFKRIAERGRLHDDAKNYNCREWRFVVRHARDAADTLYLSTRRFPNRYILNVIFNVPYRMRNCFAVHVRAKGDEYMKPWLESGLPYQYLRTRVGGVCTHQSMWAALLANARGKMSERAGQPRHCAFLLRGKDRTWGIYSNIRPYTAGVFLLWGRGYQYVVSTERAFADKVKHDYSELLMFAGDFAEKNRSHSSRLGELRRAAAFACPYNFPAWNKYTEYLQSSNADADVWKRYLKDLVRTQPEGRLVTWDFANTAFDELAAKGLDKEELAGLTAKVFQALPEPKSKIAEEMNFRRAALDKSLKRFRSRKDLQLKILSAAFAANIDSPRYLPHVFACAMDKFRKDTGMLENFFAAAGLSEGGTSGRIDWRRIFNLPNAKSTRDILRMMAAYRDKFDPPAGEGKVKEFDFGAGLVSQDALVKLSSSAKADTPQDHPRVSDATAYDLKRKGLFCTKKEIAPWVQIDLAGSVSVNGVAVDGGGEDLEVSYSENGEKWIVACTVSAVSGKARFDCSKTPIKAKHIRVTSKHGAGKKALLLRKVLVYGKRLF
jgi:hypothetical protein